MDRESKHYKEKLNLDLYYLDKSNICQYCVLKWAIMTEWIIMMQPWQTIYKLLYSWCIHIYIYTKFLCYL